MKDKDAATKLTLLTAFAFMLYNEAQAQWAYSTNDDNTVTITGYSGFATDVGVPDSMVVNGVSLPVTSIGYRAFSGNASMKNVSFGPNLRYIGVWAFERCIALRTVTFSTNLNVIGPVNFFSVNWLSIKLRAGFGFPC